MLRLVVVLAVLLSGPLLLRSVAAPFSEQSKPQFHARLSTVPIDLAMAPRVAGRGSASATLAGSTLTIAGTFEGLKTPATFAKIHAGPKGIRGPAILDLTVSNATSGSITGTVQLTPAQIEDLKNSRLYIQLHSEKAPEGNLWGWILPTEPKR
jgi:hypothetical protein